MLLRRTQTLHHPVITHSPPPTPVLHQHMLTHPDNPQRNLAPSPQVAISVIHLQRDLIGASWFVVLLSVQHIMLWFKLHNFFR